MGDERYYCYLVSFAACIVCTYYTTTVHDVHTIAFYLTQFKTRLLEASTRKGGFGVRTTVSSHTTLGAFGASKPIAVWSTRTLHSCSPAQVFNRPIRSRSNAGPDTRPTNPGSAHCLRAWYWYRLHVGSVQYLAPVGIGFNQLFLSVLFSSFFSPLLLLLLPHHHRPFWAVCSTPTIADGVFCCCVFLLP